MAVKSRLHSQWFQFCGQPGKDIGSLFDARTAAGVIAAEAGNDQSGISDRLIELDGLVEFLALQCIEGRVATDALEPVVIEHLSNIFRCDVVESSEFDSLVAQLSDLLQRACHVLT